MMMVSEAIFVAVMAVPASPTAARIAAHTESGPPTSVATPARTNATGATPGRPTRRATPGTSRAPTNPPTPTAASTTENPLAPMSNRARPTTSAARMTKPWRARMAHVEDTAYVALELPSNTRRPSRTSRTLSRSSRTIPARPRRSPCGRTRRAAATALPTVHTAASKIGRRGETASVSGPPMTAPPSANTMPAVDDTALAPRECSGGTTIGMTAIWFSSCEVRSRRNPRGASREPRRLSPRRKDASFTAPRLGSALRLHVEERGPILVGRGTVAQDELLDHLPGRIVGELHRRRLHEVGRGADQRPADPSVHGQLRAPDRVDHDAGRVGRVPHLELQVDRQRDVTEGLSLEPDLRPLPVLEPRHVVRRADVDVVGVEPIAELALHRLGLRHLLRGEALALQHVLEVHVSAEVQLVGAVQPDAAVLEELGQHPVDDRRADLRLDVIADDRQAGVAEKLRPLGIRGDESRGAVDESATGVERGLRVVPSGLLAPDGEVADHDVRAGLAESPGHIHRLLARLLDRLAVVPPQPVQGRAPLDRYACGRDVVGEPDRVVRLGEDGLGHVPPDLLAVDVESRHDLDVGHVVRAQLHVHEARCGVGRVGVTVVLQPLDQRRRTVAHAHDGDANLGHAPSFVPAGLVRRARRGRLPARRSAWMRSSSHEMSRCVESIPWRISAWV